ncbi:MAG: PqiC family protein [bacterium]|nr:PqiC family protein [bacterium]
MSGTPHGLSRIQSALLQPLLPALVLLMSIMLSGCISKPAPTTVYALEPLATSSPVISKGITLPGMIMVMPVRLPPHLRQKSIVVEEAGAGPKMLAGHLWAGPLDEQISANLVASLQTLLASPNVALYPGPRYSRAMYQVETEIIRFSGDSRTFTLRAVTTISDPNERRMLSRTAFTETFPIEGEGYSAYVAAASKVLAHLSADIAAALTDLLKPASGTNNS